MNLTAGIVGLPNVGKSTLFNAITKSEIEAANYPFATIEPNVGIVEVPDERLNVLTDLAEPNKTIPTTIEFTDIAGLVKGASKGEGLGNQFLSNIRETDAICHVVRCFEDDQIIHVDGNVDPIRDVETINLELIFSDLEQATKRLARIDKKVRTGDKEFKIEHTILVNIIDALENEKPARVLGLNEEEMLIIKHLNLLTLKPILYVANVSEEDLIAIDDNKYYQKLEKFALDEKNKVTYICAKIEEDLVELEESEKHEFLKDLGINEPGLNRLIKMTYKLLNLSTYFTVGKQEVRAWAFPEGFNAPQCAGIIHTDFSKGFIRAEVIKYKDFIELKSEKIARDKGKLSSEGKCYLMEDGDIVHFLFNV